MRTNPRTLVVRVFSLSALVLNPLTIGIALQAQTEGSYVAEPADWEVDEAVRVLRRYLVARQADEAESEDADRAAGAAAATRLRPDARPLVAGTSGAGIVGQSAPPLDDASLSISNQLHMANSSAVFKNGQLFLWDDAAGGNLGLGRDALSAATGTATHNTALGFQALQNTTEGIYAPYGSDNVALGYGAMRDNALGFRNTAVGTESLNSNVTGGGNSALGYGALAANTNGDENVAIGIFAMSSNESGVRNTAVGRGALSALTSGARNTAIGYSAGGGSNGSDNISIGTFASAPGSNTIQIGTQFGPNPQTRAFIAGIHGVAPAGGNEHEVCVDDDGQLGACPLSSRRFKQDIEPLSSDGLLALRPVTFRYREGVLGGPDLRRVGLIAEEVAQLFPDLVSRDRAGKPLTVRYELLSVLLLDELKRQHELNARQEEALRSVLVRLTTLEESVPPAD